MRQLGAVYPGALPPDGRGDDHPCAGRCLADGNIQGLTHYFDALSAGDVDAAVALVADDADFRSPMARIQGKDEIRAFLGGFDSAFPGARFEITHVIESGTSVAVEGSTRAPIRHRS
jgi:ketosteroid isomerase-like protein